MKRIRMVRDNGHYMKGSEVRVDDKKAKELVNGGYALEVKMQAAPENKQVDAPGNKDADENDSDAPPEVAHVPANETKKEKKARLRKALDASKKANK